MSNVYIDETAFEELIEDESVKQGIRFLVGKQPRLRNSFQKLSLKIY